MKNEKETKYKNKYRIASARASWWNYGWAGAYFLTICTQDRQPILGRIENGQMQLSPTGILADVFWHEIPLHAQHVSLGAFVVMPNHIHGILVLENPDAMHEKETTHDNVAETTHALSLRANDDDDATTTHDNVVETTHALSLRANDDDDATTTHDNVVETTHALSLRETLFLQEHEMTEGQKRFQNQGKNTISSIIGSYKSAVTKHANRLGFPSGWQTRFHDHIIRDYRAYQYIENYIQTNPANWGKDKFFNS